MFSANRCSLRTLSGVRYASNQSKKLGSARKSIPTRFPTQFNPVRSAANPRIQLPKGLSYNPAPSAPSPYYTPAAFLPQDDKRVIRYGEEGYPVTDMPEVSPADTKSYNLTVEDINKMQQLRKENPEKWTRKALAKEFNCSPFFVSLATSASEERLKEMDRRLLVIKSLWTETRIRTRRDRERRHKLSLRDAN